MFYYCVLVTTGNALPPVVSAWSKEALAKAADPEMDRWHYGTSPYLDFGSSHFEQVRELWDLRPQMSDDCWRAEYDLRMVALETALSTLDAEGLFGRGALRNQLMINVEVVPPDFTNTERAIRLNPRPAIERWLEEAAEP